MAPNPSLLQVSALYLAIITLSLPGWPATTFARVEALGVNWGRNSSHPLPPSKVAELLKSNNVTRVKLSDADPLALQSLSGSNIAVTVGIPNSFLRGLNSSLKAAESWVHDNLTRYLSADASKVRIEYIAVGDEPFLQSYGMQYIPFVMGAATNIQAALTKANLADKVKVVVPCSFDAFQFDSVPSEGHFRPEINNTIVQLLTFLSKHNSPFFASISPFDLLQQNKNLSLDFTLFRATKHPLKDGHKLYNNTFDLIYDALVSALLNASFPQIEIVIGQIGWPTDGAANANSSIAEIFMKKLLTHLRSKSGTPLRPHIPPKETYILSLLDEDQRSIINGGYNRHWGVFTFDGQAKYSVNLGGDSGNLVNARNVAYLSAKWCVVNNNKDMSNATASALEACLSADCSPLSPGGSCYNLSWPGNVSYAFNSYYQGHNQSPESCDFGGLGMITIVDPSVGNCWFSVQLQTSGESRLQASFSILCTLLSSALVYVCLRQNFGG
ncbi:hypothetical protein V2J09_018194 [Rumex salicifolius]